MWWKSSTVHHPVHTILIVKHDVDSVNYWILYFQKELGRYSGSIGGVKYQVIQKVNLLKPKKYIG